MAPGSLGSGTRAGYISPRLCTTIVPIDNESIDRSADERAQTSRNEAKTNSHVVERVNVFQLGRQTSRDRVVASKDEAVGEEQRTSREMGQETERREGVGEGKSSPCRCRRYSLRCYLFYSSLLIVTGNSSRSAPRNEDRPVPPSVRDDAPIPDDSPTRLREEQRERDEEQHGCNGEEPEDRLPPQILTEEAAEDGAQRWRQNVAQGGDAHVCAAFGGGDYIRGDGGREGDSAAAAAALDSAQDEQCHVAVLEGKGNIADDVDEEAEEVGRTTAGLVG